MSGDGSTQDVEKVLQGTAHGRRFKVVHVRGGHFAGYVRTNLGPQWVYDDLAGWGKPIEAHGGLTYGVDEDGWIGFDCAHSGDVCILDGEIQTDYGRSDYCQEWTPEDVAAECRSVAKQIEGLEELLTRFEDRGWGFPGDDDE